MEPNRARTEGVLRARRRRASSSAPGPTAAESARDLDEIRRIVLVDERARLEALESQQPFVSPATVGAVLPEAIEGAARSRGHELAVALEPPVVEAVRGVVTRDAELIGEILSPTIGAAVRRAVAQAFAALLQRIDTVLERSLSPRSLLWRIEAWRTGQRFAEIVLARTLLYRVEQAFLIHSPSGVALRHVVAPGVGALDPDQVASMLAAIDAFVVEAFAAGEPGAHVAQFEAGDLTVWIDRDALVTVALVVRGPAPRELADLARDTRERIAIERRDELCAFSSDVRPFASTEATLAGCLREVRAQPRGRAHVWLAAALALLALGGVAGAWSWWSGRAAASRRLAASIAALEAEPGIVVTAATAGDGRARITGLRDPLAAAPDEILARRGLRGAALDFAPFESRDPRLAERRVRAALRAPPSVRLALSGGTLRLEGEAPRAWIERARIASTVLPEVERLDDAGLRPDDDHAAIDALERLAIPFAPRLGGALRGRARAARSSGARARGARVEPGGLHRGVGERRGAGRWAGRRPPGRARRSRPRGAPRARDRGDVPPVRRPGGGLAGARARRDVRGAPRAL